MFLRCEGTANCCPHHYAEMRRPDLLYAERPPKYDEKAALRWLERYLTEGSPRLRHPTRSEEPSGAMQG